MSHKTFDTHKKPLLERKLLALFGGFNGFGLIIAFWVLTLLMLGGIMLLIIGALNINWFLFFLGLICLRVYLYIAKINRKYIDNVRPFDG